MDLGQVHSVRTPRALGWRKGLLTFRSGEMETTRVRPLLEMKLFTTRSVCHVGEEKMLSLVWWLFDLKKKKKTFFVSQHLFILFKIRLIKEPTFQNMFYPFAQDIKEKTYRVCFKMLHRFSFITSRKFVLSDCM